MRLLSTTPAPDDQPRAAFTTLLFLGAILLGGLAGFVSPGTGTVLGDAVDPLILLLVGALFLTLRLDGLAALRRAPRTVLLALTLNFLLIPLVAFGLTSVLLPDEALRVGVLIYCLFPCTDWYLGFTRMAGGDTTTGAALIPIQLVLQLALYPVWLALFTGHQVGATTAVAGPTLMTYLALPAGIALALRLLLHLCLPDHGRRSAASAVDRAVPFVIAALILCLFAANVDTVLADPLAFAGVLPAVFLFFVITYLLGAGTSRLFRLRPPEHTLLTMTTSARNAPLMLAVTTVTLPNQPVVYAAIVLGMLIEFPHLTALTHLLRRNHSRHLVARHAGVTFAPTSRR